MKKVLLYSIPFILIIVVVISVFIYGQKVYDDKLLSLDRVAVTMNYDGFADENECKEIESMFYVTDNTPEKYKNIIMINLSIENNSDEAVRLAVNDLENEYFFVQESCIMIEPWESIAAGSKENTTLYILTSLSEENENSIELLKNNQFSFNIDYGDSDNYENRLSKDIDCKVKID